MIHTPSPTLNCLQDQGDYCEASTRCVWMELGKAQHTLPLAKTRGPHLALTCPLLLRLLAVHPSILQVGCSEDPFLSEP